MFNCYGIDLNRGRPSHGPEGGWREAVYIDNMQAKCKNEEYF